MSGMLTIANLQIPSSARFIIPSDDVNICEVEALAISESLHVISGGSQVILCSHIPVGAARMAIKDRQAFGKTKEN